MNKSAQVRYVPIPADAYFSTQPYQRIALAYACHRIVSETGGLVPTGSKRDAKGNESL